MMAFPGFALAALVCLLDTGNDVHVWDVRSAVPPGLAVTNAEDKDHDVTVRARCVRRDGTVLFDGVREWFSLINAYGEAHGVRVEHYINSSGLKEIIEGKHDDLPESAFLFVGTIDEAVEKAKKG